MSFYRKYRSQKFGEMVGQEHVVRTLLQAIKSGKIVHSYLLTGPRGIGKTSTARLLAKAINCESLTLDRAAKKEVDGEPCGTCDSCREIVEGRSIDVIEIDAASFTGVDNIRDIIEKARLAPTKSFKKIYIIDEVHMLSKSAFNALLKTMEEPPDHVVFIMATTEVHKIPATILSRAQRYDFKRASKEEIVTNLRKIAKAENIDIEEGALDLISVLAQGGHRDAIGLLEQISGSKGKITQETARKILGVAESEEVFKFVGTIFNNNPEEGLKIVHCLYEDGHDMHELCKQIIELLRRTLLLKVAGETVFDDTKENLIKIRELSEGAEVLRILQVANIFIESANLLKEINYPVLPLEMAVVRAANANNGNQSQPVVSEQTVQKTVSLPKDEPLVGVQKRSQQNVDNSEKKEVGVEKTENTPVSSEENIDDDLVPVPVLEMTRDIWTQITEKAKAVNATLSALLHDAWPEKLTDKTLTLGVKFPFHKERISEAKNAQILEEIVSCVLGNKTRIACVIAPKKTIKTVPSDTNIDMEQAVAEVFGV